MIETGETSTQYNSRVPLLTIVGIVIAVVAVGIAIGATLMAQRAMESADQAMESADQAERAIERHQRASGAESSTNPLFDPRADFLASTAHRRDQLEDGLEQWKSFYGRYQNALLAVQYRAYTDFFDAYPITEQFFFVSREEFRLNAALPLSATDRDSYEAFRYWLNLRQSMSN